jgi:hypothetical protein
MEIRATFPFHILEEPPQQFFKHNTNRKVNLSVKYFSKTINKRISMILSEFKFSGVFHFQSLSNEDILFLQFFFLLLINVYNIH